MSTILLTSDLTGEFISVSYNARYVYYEYDRIYDPDKKYTTVKRVTIGSRTLKKDEIY